MQLVEQGRLSGILVARIWCLAGRRTSAFDIELNLGECDGEHDR